MNSEDSFRFRYIREKAYAEVNNISKYVVKNGGIFH